MYKIENQVCTFEQAKKFTEWGIELQSYFVWLRTKPSDKSPIYIYKIYPRWLAEQENDSMYLNAYSCAELGTMLPDSLVRKEDNFYPVARWRLFQMETSTDYRAAYFENGGWSAIYKGEQQKHEAHAKADLLLLLLRKKIIKPEDLTLTLPYYDQKREEYEE